MRIALWNTNYFKGIGGSEKVVNELLNQFAASGIETFLIANRWRYNDHQHPYFGRLNPKVTVYLNTFPNPLLATRKPLKMVQQVLLYAKASLQLISFLKKSKLHVMHLHFVSVDLLLLVVYKFFFHYRLVVTFRGTDLAMTRSSKLARLKVALALKFSDVVTAVSKEMCHMLESEFGCQKAVYTSNGVDPDRMREVADATGTEQNKGAFVYCGRLTPVKRVPFLVEAFCRAVENGCKRDFYIIGGGQQREEIERLIGSFRIQKRVHLLGPLKHAEVLEVISRSFCLVLSSSSEGCPNVVLEAMALGKPVIAPDIAGLQEIVVHGENGYLFPVNQLDALAQLLVEIAANEELASEMGIKAVKTITKKFTFDSTIKYYLDIYSCFEATQS